MSEPTSPVDRALRALADSVADSRPRLPGDGVDPGIPVAATVVIVRDGPGGPEVLLTERPDRGSFAGAWVFPGGKLEPADEDGDGDGDGDGRSEEDVARRAGIRETREETGLVLDPHALTTISCWDPPPGIALRIRTWFFAAQAPVGELTPSAHEVVTAEWLRPADALERHARGDFTLYPPTWVTLTGLGDQTDVDALLASIRLGGPRRFETIARPGASGPMLLWQGDAEYDPDAALPASARHRLELTGLPWIYTRAD